MPKYQVTFITYKEESVVVSCHRDDAEDRAVEELAKELGAAPLYDEVEISEVKP